MDLAREFLDTKSRALLFEHSGWFPHSTFPTEIFDEGLNEEELDERVLAYYRVNWTQIHKAIEYELSGYLIAEREKRVLGQALIAHGNGLFDLVSPTLFSEVERAVRVHFYENKVGHFSVVQQIKSRLKEMPVSVFPDRLTGYFTFEIFSRQLYASIRTDAERERFSCLSLPNRNAIIHGLLDYESEKSSLNSIFIASYVFQLITAIKIEETKELIAERKM